MIRYLLATGLLVIAGSAVAQENPPPGERRSKPREEIARMIDAYVGENLQEKLGLTDDQRARALPVVRRLHSERRRFAERKMRALHQMRKMARAGSIGDAPAAELLHELKAAEAEEWAAIRSDQEAVDAVLTPAQQVKFRILEAEIEQRLRAAMARMRAQRRDGPGRERGDRPPNEPPAPR